MTTPEHRDPIQARLIGLLEEMNGADTARMLTAMEELDRIAATRSGELDPRLLHFLERRSYAKAREFLRGSAAVPAGKCGPAPER